MKPIRELYDDEDALLKYEDYKRNSWRQVTKEEIKPDDPLGKNLDLSNEYWIADRNGYLVPKSKVYEWLNSYERQLPWQEAQDLSVEQHLENKKGDYEVHELGKQRDNLLKSLAIGIPSLTLLGEGLVLAPFTTTGSLAGSILGEKTFNKYYKGNWAKDLNNMTGIPEEVGEYLNPGAIIGGGLTYPSLRFLNANKYKLLWQFPQTKRATEVALKTSKGYDGFRSTLDALAHSSNSDKLDVLKYILFNKQPEGKFFKTFGKDSQYTGLMKDLTYAEKEQLGNDIIDAYVYGKKLSPGIADFVGTGDKVSNIGPHKSFVEALPINKRKKVQIYKTSVGTKENLSPEELSTDKLIVVGKDGSLKTNTGTNDINAGGHYVEIDPKTRTYRSSDAWKFGENSYMNKWMYPKMNKSAIKGKDQWEYNIPFMNKNINVNVNPQNTRINIPIWKFNVPINLSTDKILRTGLKIAEQGNPVITITPPVPY